MKKFWDAYWKAIVWASGVTADHDNFAADYLLLPIRMVLGLVLLLPIALPIILLGALFSSGGPLLFQLFEKAPAICGIAIFFVVALMALGALQSRRKKQRRAIPVKKK